MSNIKDIKLAPSGKMKIDWVRKNMPLLSDLYEEFGRTKPFKGLKVALAVHMEAKTAFLCMCMKNGGAEMYATGCNPLSTQDDVAAAVAEEGIEVFAVRGCTMEEYEANLCKVLEVGPNIIIDDGGDLVHLMHTKYRDLLPGVIGGCEETTTGIHRLKALDRDGKLAFPMVMVNEADCKHMFDNRYGTGQSVWNAINKNTNLIVAGKNVVVAGYGWCGRGTAMRAKGLGAKVIVTEVNPVKALEAHMDGFEVMSMDQAAEVGDILVTVTGCDNVITPKHFEKIKDGAILCNAGHFDVEVDVASLRKMATKTYQARENIEGFVLANGKTLFVIGEGRLVNLAAGDGHPAEIMDMSFAIQALSAEWLAKHKNELKPGVVPVPEEIDKAVAERKLATLGKKIDVLTEEQKQYLGL